MKRIFIAMLGVIVLAGCSDDLDQGKMTKQCIDGVVYHTYKSGYRSAMAVAIDSKTLQPKTCNQYGYNR